VYYRASICARREVFIRQYLAGQVDSLHSQLHFSEVELCGTKRDFHGSPQTVITGHLNVSGNFTAN
jgi:hypothetical protein